MLNKTLLYDTFNARYLSYQQIADSFIPNPEFLQLHGNNSMLLMGPRGCGKTTLLKMLTPAGLNYWKANNADTPNFNFTAIYIPSDIQWKNQLDYLNNQLKDEKKFNEIVSQFLFSVNVQIALCKTFNSIIDFSNSTPTDKLLQEEAVCIALIDAWNIERPISPSFDDIELKLLKRVTQVNALVNQSIFIRPEGNLMTILPEFVFEDFFDSVKIGCKIFEQKLKLDENYKWALCFDELEITPKFLQIKLLTYLRSVDQKYLFKLTTTPLFHLENNLVEASAGNDFTTIKLWVYDESGLTNWRVFCDNLILKRLKMKFNISTKTSLIDVFKKYSLDDIIKEELNQKDLKEKEKLHYKGVFEIGTGEGSSVNFLFRYLSNKDKSFNDFLIKRGINAVNPFATNKNVAKSIFLKYKTDAVYRLLFNKRSRKNPPIHYGIPHLFDICDGNPRLVIGLVDDILNKSGFNGAEISTISNGDQSQIVVESSKRYYNLLKNHPDSTIMFKDSEFNLADDILKVIGDFSHYKIIQEDFSITSPSTFIVDDEVQPKIIKLLEIALYLGAIVYLDPVESLSNTGVLGKRFRLSSFLTPYFKVPNRISSQINLSTVLNIEKNKHQTQIELD
jgi:hypothetical protein